MFSTGIFNELIRLEDVVSNLLTPFCGFSGAEFVNTFGGLFEFHFRELSAKDFEGFFLVLELGTFVLNGDDGIGREMGDADGGVGGVDGLTAVSAGMISVDSEVFFVEFNLIVGFDDGEDFDEREGSLAQVISVKGRETDEAMDAMFGF